MPRLNAKKRVREVLPKIRKRARLAKAMTRETELVTQTISKRTSMAFPASKTEALGQEVSNLKTGVQVLQ